MKKHHYPFAATFIRLAILLAILTTLAGIGIIVSNFSEMQAAIQAEKYYPNPELLEQAQRLERLYAGTRERIALTLEDPTLPASLPAVDFASAIAAAQKQKGTEQPEALVLLADQSQSSVQGLKEFHVASFERAVDSLRQALLARARELKQQFGQSSSNSTATTPSGAASASTANQAATANKFRLFNDPPANDRQRMRNLENVREFLNELRKQSQREESLDQIRRAQIYLTRAEAMLDQLQMAIPKDSGIEANRPVESTMPTQEQMVSRAEEIASQLEQIKLLIRQSLYDSWQVDEAISALRSAARSDLVKAETSRARIHSIRSDSLHAMGITLLITIAAAFLILVLADFLRAFLNLSVNSDQLSALKLHTPSEDTVSSQATAVSSQPQP